MNLASSVKNRMQGGGGGGKELSLSDIPRVHHVFMEEYGWISPGEFKSLELPAFWNLLKCINDKRKAENDSFKKSSRRGRR